MSEEISKVNITISVNGLDQAKGELARFLSPKTVDAIIRILPIKARAALLNKQVYFQIPVKLGPEKPHKKAEAGDIAFFPMGSSICIFYDNVRPYGAVNLIGKIRENLELFKKIKEGTFITVEKS